jgi:hypothetical protein
MPMLTMMSAIMRPRRLRSSMNRVEIMAGVGIHDPLESREPRGGAVAVSGVGAGALTLVIQ